MLRLFHEEVKMVTKPFFCRISSPTIFVKGVVKKKAKNDTGKKKQQSSLTTMMFFIKKVPQVRRHQWVRPKKILPTPPWISITTHFSAQAEVPQLRSGLVPHDLEIFETVFRPLPRLGSWDPSRSCGESGEGDREPWRGRVGDRFAATKIWAEEVRLWIWSWNSLDKAQEDPTSVRFCGASRVCEWESFRCTRLYVVPWTLSDTLVFRPCFGIAGHAGAVRMVWYFAIWDRGIQEQQHGRTPPVLLWILRVREVLPEFQGNYLQGAPERNRWRKMTKNVCWRKIPPAFCSWKTRYGYVILINLIQSTNLTQLT